jgi:hypothetical protein
MSYASAISASTPVTLASASVAPVIETATIIVD